MEFAIAGKVALITGAASGLGYYFAKELLKQGLQGIALIDIDDVKGQAARNEFKEEFGPESCIFMQIDAAQESKMQDAFELTVKTFGHLDIVVNNAGVVSEIDWKKCLDINLGACMIGTALAIDTYLPKYKSGAEAVIINTASIAAIDPVSAAPIYTSTKYGVLGLCRAYGVKEHYEQTKVRVIGICPGMTATSILSSSILKKDYQERCKGAKPLPLQQPEFVATALIDIIERSKNGAVWIIENTKPAYELEFLDRQKMRKT